MVQIWYLSSSKSIDRVHHQVRQAQEFQTSCNKREYILLKCHMSSCSQIYSLVFLLRICFQPYNGNKQWLIFSWVWVLFSLFCLLCTMLVSEFWVVSNEVSWFFAIMTYTTPLSFSEQTSCSQCWITLLRFHFLDRATVSFSSSLFLVQSACLTLTRVSSFSPLTKSAVTKLNNSLVYFVTVQQLPNFLTNSS